jgi:hypothetical protein
VSLGAEVFEHKHFQKDRHDLLIQMSRRSVVIPEDRPSPLLQRRNQLTRSTSSSSPRDTRGEPEGSTSCQQVCESVPDNSEPRADSFRSKPAKDGTKQAYYSLQALYEASEARCTFLEQRCLQLEAMCSALMTSASQQRFAPQPMLYPVMTLPSAQSTSTSSTSTPQLFQAPLSLTPSPVGMRSAPQVLYAPQYVSTYPKPQAQHSAPPGVLYSYQPATANAFPAQAQYHR